MTKITLFLLLTALILTGCTEAAEPVAMVKQFMAKTKQPTEYQAAFAIFTHNTFRVFNAPMYHNLSESAFITSQNPNIIHLKQSNLTWNDFFSTLPFSLTFDCLTTGLGDEFCSNTKHRLDFYLNGQLTPNALTQTISPGDQLLVTYGNPSQSQLQSQLDKIPTL